LHDLPRNSKPHGYSNILAELGSYDSECHANDYSNGRALRGTHGTHDGPYENPDDYGIYLRSHREPNDTSPDRGALRRPHLRAIRRAHTRAIRHADENADRGAHDDSHEDADRGPHDEPDIESHRDTFLRTLRATHHRATHVRTHDLETHDSRTHHDETYVDTHDFVAHNGSTNLRTAPPRHTGTLHPTAHTHTDATSHECTI